MTPDELKREDLAKEMASVFERNGGPPWDAMGKELKEEMREYADVALNHISALQKQADAGRELRDGIETAITSEHLSDRKAFDGCFAHIKAYDAAVKESGT